MIAEFSLTKTQIREDGLAQDRENDININIDAPMTTVLMIRHGESAANAGQQTCDPAEIPLTSHGRLQAEAISTSFQDVPDLIISSPFRRARETAAPTISRFPHVPTDIWPVQEFTYLSPARCANTTMAQRRPWVEDYWLRADTDWCDGDGAESFKALIARVDHTLDRLHALPHQTVVIFGHGQFMQAMQWRLARADDLIDRIAMQGYRSIEHRKPIANGQTVRITTST